ncbi:bile acid:sodium symporter family protein [Paenibacillus koleovorans]|uniref:bile acid:sodium symporter family protein n=1 Tax=Paenibacillus koleovorans TaxID=121608 RepID=UPI000FD81873|nr:bile acid:sodium symporter family protein [Paenibacillus koleovorans]
MLTLLNKSLEKWMPLITPISVMIGLAAGGVLSPFTSWVPWIFALMTFAGSLSMNFRDMQRVLVHPLPILVFLFVLHLVMPLFAWGAGHLAFPNDPLTITGIVLVLSIPTGIVSFIWVSIYRGHTALTLSMILIDTLLSPFIVPYTLSVLVGAKVEMDTVGMLTQLVWMVVLPSILGMVLNQLTRGKVKQAWSPTLSPLSKIGLAVVIIINSSVIAPLITEWNMKILYIALICVVVVAAGYLLGWLAGRLLRLDRDMAVCMVFNCGMRNVSVGAVLAISFFPPQVAFPTIVGMLTQQLMASLFGYLFFGRRGATQLPELPRDVGNPS